MPADLSEIHSSIAEQQAQQYFSHNKFDPTNSAWVEACVAANVSVDSFDTKFLATKVVKAESRYTAAAMLVLVHELHPSAAGDASVTLKVRLIGRWSSVLHAFSSTTLVSEPTRAQDVRMQSAHDDLAKACVCSAFKC